MPDAPATLRSPGRVLLIDDEPPIVEGYRMALRLKGVADTVTFTDSRQARDYILSSEFDAVFLDLNMPHISGEVLLKELGQHHPGVPVIVVTGKDDVTSAVACMKAGAHDYLVKPVSRDRIVTAAKAALRLRNMAHENALLSDKLLGDDALRQPKAFRGILTVSPRLRSIFKYIEAVADSDAAVLVTGETGTGKELIARALHDASDRTGHFVAVNAAGMDDSAFSDTFFGHRRGAYTGATTTRGGLIERAKGGTLFLDEIGDLSQASQVKLLRLLQEGEYMPLGQDTPLKTDARVVAATNADLTERRRDGTFRNDLFFRFKTHAIHLPPLRDRHEDIPVLLDHFIGRAARTLTKQKPVVTADLITLLSTYHFPGNIRELEAMAMDAVARHESGTLSLAVFREHIRSHAAPAGTVGARVGDGTDTPYGLQFGPTLPPIKEAKRLFVDEAMRRTGGKKNLAAGLLGVTRQALNWHLRQKQSDTP